MHHQLSTHTRQRAIERLCWEVARVDGTTGSSCRPVAVRRMLSWSRPSLAACHQTANNSSTIPLNKQHATETRQQQIGTASAVSSDSNGESVHTGCPVGALLPLWTLSFQICSMRLFALFYECDTDTRTHDTTDVSRKDDWQGS